MSEIVLTDATILIAGLNFSGQATEFTPAQGVESLDKTTFGQTSRLKKGGLYTAALRAAGLWRAGAEQVDVLLHDAMGDDDQVVTAFAGAITEGSTTATGLACKAVELGMDFGSPAGDLLKAGFSVEGQTKFVRAICLKNFLSTGLTSDTNGTAFNIGAVGAAQYLYAGLHIITPAGTTCTVKIQSDDAEAFLDPTDRITFSAATGVGSQWATPVAGAIADTWWRASWTRTGTFYGLVWMCIAA